MRKSAIRFIILNLIVMVGMLGIVAVPDEELNMLMWLFVLILTKAIGFGAIILSMVLLEEWFGIKIIEDKKEVVE